jgi:phosphoglycerate dehydrogenase-like enzyme
MLLVIDAPVPTDFERILAEVSPEVQLKYAPVARMPLTPDLLATVEVLYTGTADFDPAAAPKLRWVQLTTAGINHVAHRPVMHSRIPVASATGAYSPAVAEYALGLLLALTRRIPRGCRHQAEHCWLGDDFTPWIGDELYGKTMGILGYGSIGRQIAHVAQAMGMKVLACKRRPDVQVDHGFLRPGSGDPSGEIPSAWFGVDQIGAMFQLSDVVMICVPLNAETRGLVGYEELAALPAHAYVVNISRGNIVDETVLAELLRTSRLAGAAFDVFAEQPLPRDSPLWDTPNLLVMPYLGSVTRHQAKNAAQVLLENLRRYRCGEPLLNLVDKEFMY